MHTRESKQKTKWLDQNPTKNRNNIFKIKNQILHAHYICFVVVVVLKEGRGKGRRQGRDGKGKGRKRESGRAEGGKRKKERKPKKSSEEQSPTAESHFLPRTCRGQSVLVLCAGGSDGLVGKSCLTLCDPMDCSPPSFSVHGISQARVL